MLAPRALKMLLLVLHAHLLCRIAVIPALAAVYPSFPSKKLVLVRCICSSMASSLQNEHELRSDARSRVGCYMLLLYCTWCSSLETFVYEIPCRAGAAILHGQFVASRPIIVQSIEVSVRVVPVALSCLRLLLRLVGLQLLRWDANMHSSCFGLLPMTRLFAHMLGGVPTCHFCIRVPVL